MIKVHQITYNPFAENTYVLTNENKDAIIIDPGMYGDDERVHFDAFIEEREFSPVKLILTHAHLDHVFGLNHVAEKYKLTPQVNAKELMIYDNASSVANQYGLSMKPLISPLEGVEDNSELIFGDAKLKVIFTPGHSPGSVCFYNQEQNWIIGGDVLFQSSIGRTDLPGGDFETLINSIKTRLFILPDETRVYSGHGPSTTIGVEKMTNPFLT